MNMTDKGDKDFYTTYEIKNGKFIEISVRKEVRHSNIIEKPTGNAIISHIGAYGRIKFIFNDKTYESLTGAGAFGKSDKGSIATTEDNSSVIDVTNIKFDRENPDKLFDIYIKNNNPKIYWIPIGNWNHSVSGQKFWHKLYPKYI